jgi:hypothetical protein
VLHYEQLSVEPFDLVAEVDADEVVRYRVSVE